MPTLTERLEAVKKRQDKILAKKDGAGKKTKPGTPTPTEVFGNRTAPHARKGEDPLSSRGFMITKLIGALSKNPALGGWEDAKAELALAADLRKASEGYGISLSQDGVLAPFCLAFFPEDVQRDFEQKHGAKAFFRAGASDADLDEMKSLGRKYGMKAAMSWLDQTLGGSLVGPPAYGEFIDLFRNQEVMSQAGATILPLPPTGRYTFPRQTGVTTGYWPGEGTAVTASNLTTGQLTLSAKKVGALSLLNNDLIRYASVAAEGVVRMDIMRTLALTFDQALLESAGSNLKPLGLINTPSIATVTLTTPPSGNTLGTLAPQDLWKFPSKVESNNAPGDITFIMRPEMYYALLQRRIDAITAADGAGLFVFSPMRAAGDPLNDKRINGYRVVTSTQISQSRVQGSATTGTYILAGHFPDYYMAMFGAIEFAIATQGNPTGGTAGQDIFAQDQTAIRAFLIGDGGARHPGAFAWADAITMA